MERKTRPTVRFALRAAKRSLMILSLYFTILFAALFHCKYIIINRLTSKVSIHVHVGIFLFHSGDKAFCILLTDLFAVIDTDQLRILIHQFTEKIKGRILHILTNRKDSLIADTHNISFMNLPEGGFQLLAVISRTA